MGRFVDELWPGDPMGQSRSSRTPCKYQAYVPDELADLDLRLPASLAADIADVERDVRALNSAHPGLANLEPMARFLLRAEAVASSWMEGLVINVRRLARSEAAQREGFEVADETARTVLGNIQALDRALRVADDPTARLTVDDLQNIHRALMSGTRDHRWAGVIRTEQNWIGGQNPCVADFVPPPATEVPRLLDDLMNYLSGDDHPALVQAALAHSQFETIHPFADGNGRTGRALIQLVLRRRGLATQVVPPVSLILATKATAYVDALMRTRSLELGTDHYLGWIDLFVDSTGRACNESDRFARELVELEQRARGSVGSIRTNSAVDLIISALPALPVFTSKTMGSHIGRSHVAVNEAITRLLDAGVIQQIKVGRRNRAFEVVGLFEAFTGFERVLAGTDD